MNCKGSYIQIITSFAKRDSSWPGTDAMARSSIHELESASYTHKHIYIYRYIFIVTVVVIDIALYMHASVSLSKCIYIYRDIGIGIDIDMYIYTHIIHVYINYIVHMYYLQATNYVCLHHVVHRHQYKNNDGSNH